MSKPIKLKHWHEAAIRAIFVGMRVRDAAELHGVGRTYMSMVYHSEAGQAYLRHLMDLTNQYTACMVALGLQPSDIVGRDRDGKAKPRPMRDIRRAVADRSRCIGAKRRGVGAPAR